MGDCGTNAAHAQAVGYLRALTDNVDAWYGGAIEFETFKKLNRGIWDDIRKAGSGVENLVLFGLREELPPNGESGRCDGQWPERCNEG